MFFTGEHKSRPQQLLRGTRYGENQREILRRAEEDRRRRDELRRKIVHTTIVQSVARRYIARARLRSHFLTELDRARSELSATQDAQLLFHYVRAANVFMFRRGDGEAEGRFVFFLCQNIIRLKENCLNECSRDARTAVSLAKFVGGALQLAGNGGQKLAVTDVNSTIRLAEIFLGNSSLSAEVMTVICGVLIKRAFFRSCLTILTFRSIGMSLGTTTPAGALQLSLLNVLLLPLNILLQLPSTAASRLAVSLFCSEVLSQSHQAIVSNFVIRALSEPTQKMAPVVPFIGVLAELIGEKPVDIWLCWSLMVLLRGWAGMLTTAKHPAVLRVVSCALSGLFHVSKLVDDDEEEDAPAVMEVDEDADEEMDVPPLKVKKVEVISALEVQARQEVQDILETAPFITMILESFEVRNTHCVEDVAGLFTSLLLNPAFTERPISLFYKFAFNMAFLRALWELIGQHNIIPSKVLNGSSFDFSTCKTWIRLYSVFCRLLICTMATVYDDEFSGGAGPGVKTGGAEFEFTLDEVVDIASSARDVATGLVFFTYNTSPHPDPEYPALMAYFFKSVVQIIKELHDRDARRAFCPEDFWNSPRLSSLADRTKRTAGSGHVIFDIFEKINPFKSMKNNTVFQGCTVEELRFSLVLDQMPCLIPFPQRLLFVYMTLKADKSTIRGEFDFIRQDGHIHVKVRRDHIYEDALSDLGEEVVPDMRKAVKVTFQNLAGLDEAGVDGGGLFREFMNQTLRAGFDANRGIFRTNEDSALYPNPEASILFPNDMRQHFFFLGRLLGKAIYENLLTELHFADFFLKKLLAKNSTGNVDIHYLKSLDPMLFKNLLYLKQYPGDVADLQLDFSAAVDEMGLTRQIDLKPNGRNILVTKENVVEYIFMMADFKLNRQIKQHTAYFRDGLNQVVPIQLLQIFNFKELQTLISGTEEPIDVRDWRKHTAYGSPYDEEHPTIQMFWRVVQSFDEPTKRKLLKFVTSCSRPPLLGFKDLPHKFTIHPVSGQDRLPTASTCMNLLKLPNIPDEVKLRQKLLYAVESDAGFELS